MVSEEQKEMEPVLEEEELAPQAALDDNCLHPLESSWDLWYLSNDKQKEWDDRLTKLMTFNTVEDFWALYHHLQLPSKLPIGSDYMLFKTGIQPKWEDPKNENGGKWTIETTRGFRSQLDAAWLETLLSIIGEGFGDAGDDINGAVVQVRKKCDRLQIWTGHYENEEKTMSIGRTYKKVLKLPEKMFLQYQAHKDSITRIGSTCKTRLMV